MTEARHEISLIQPQIDDSPSVILRGKALLNYPLNAVFNDEKNSTNNTRIFYEYTKYLKDAKRIDDSTVDGVMKLINRFEEYTDYLDFKKLSKAIVLTATRHLKSLFSI